MPSSALYQQVTEKIVAQMERGELPWDQPWTRDTTLPVTMPQNAMTARPYSGVNVLLLWDEQTKRAWPTAQWATYRQAQAAGGQVRRGEHGTRIVFMSRLTTRKERDRAAAENRVPKPMFMLRAYAVFNLAQIDGLEPATPAASVPDTERHHEADRIIRATGATVHHGGNVACYMPSRDLIAMPHRHQFRTPHDYYCVHLHELAHWTGATHRLDRSFDTRFSTDAYAVEELTAELSAAFSCARLGITPTTRHADYLSHWIRVLKQHPRAIVSVASAASRATDYIFRDRLETPAGTSAA